LLACSHESPNDAPERRPAILLLELLQERETHTHVHTTPQHTTAPTIAPPAAHQTHAMRDTLRYCEESPANVQAVTQHNTTQHNTTQHNTTQHNTTQHNTTQHNTTQHNTTQHNTTQYNTTQHNTTRQRGQGTCRTVMAVLKASFSRKCGGNDAVTASI